MLDWSYIFLDEFSVVLPSGCCAVHGKELNKAVAALDILRSKQGAWHKTTSALGKVSTCLSCLPLEQLSINRNCFGLYTNETKLMALILIEM